MQSMEVLISSLAFATLVAASGCDDIGGDDNEAEVITTVTLELVPMGGGTTVTAAFNDPDGDGGGAPTIDPLNLASGKTYAMTVRFENRLEDPPEEITDEVRDEGDQHFVFFTGTAVNGPASQQPAAPLTHAYTDMDGSGIPIGLGNTIAAAAAGTGQLTVTLVHLPPVNDTAAKTAELPMQIKSSGFGAVGGSIDAQVSFMVTVQ